MKEKIEKLKELFPYEYVGGGYFREKGTPQGEKAEIIHGMEAIKYLFDKMSNKEFIEN